MKNQIAAIAVLALFPWPEIAAEAQERRASSPSYNCNATRLNPAERAICADQTLARLDVKMVEDYTRIVRRLQGIPKQRFLSAQATWRAYRNSCKGDRGCLARRYADRIKEFTDQIKGVRFSLAREFGGQSASNASAPQNQTLTPNGWLSVQQPDGTIVEYDPGSGSRTSRYPDGRVEEQRVTAITTQRPDRPALPPDLEYWSDNVETQLTTILSDLLSEEDYDAYGDLLFNKDYYERVDLHLLSIRFFTGEEN